MKLEPSEQPDSAAHSGLCASSISRRDFLKGAGVAVATPVGALGQTRAAPAHADGTPEQIHLTFGDDPSRTVFVSWASPAQAIHPRVILHRPGAGTAVVHAVQRTYTDGMNGQTVFMYHAKLDGLEAHTSYHYSVTADNDRRRRTPFTATIRTAPRGHMSFRWTSYGDLATPMTSWTMSSPQSRHAVDAVERFQPLLHLLNGDLCYANLNPTAQPQVWADFGNNVQRSAAHRPWMPCPGNHEIEFCNGEQGLDSYLTRYALPDNGTPFSGRWYSFRVGSALFISLAADDVVYQDSGAFHAGPGPLTPAPSTGHQPIEPGTSLYVHGYSGGAQTRWLEETLAAAEKDTGIDWIIVQMHQDALSSSQNGNGSDRGIRETWLPLFDRYGVDLVLCGHDHDYERSWPVRGCNHHVGRDAQTGKIVDTYQPKPVMTSEPANGRFDARQGTIHLILGGGGTNTPTDVYGVNPTSGSPQAKVITKANRPFQGQVPEIFVKHGADALEDATWSARRNTVTGYGIGVFDLDPGGANEPTTITMRYYHAPGADHAGTSDYQLFDTVVLAKERRDTKRG
jgi:Calcineurin-like phosphoesterase/Purple acid Phosphatase, N-terminal domain/TAT (twin-arginine translocation) pathway signal sequence